ncbi:zf-HC2 domain-containing protein [Myxococcus llanfairpwllgwyngyllgogerychwyrndrobwllllantysiliogogogochensis]|uniref:Zf-HC2 domain-containing protein n=1 Tax=Myxococcus llanfairpwllgwyngyllgogerychwyrndrobwllllantysiliogogogochensis TaxID=2590453 RepID=A0A540WRP0_9BACT|nr:zf-HC2 domain-containing protein [Myxococcus llanfairpwllgwyngyllgogerychwyrndrobwllllantysiliogogogochensis]TQF11074.1 zf-HC2 domain-containing protein [Myxococcus llanfairpwllgwyngyllgogerychwyrndrobwllllantysiliogogogochensis]
MKPQNLHAHEDRLLDFAYGELPAPDAQVVESHLQGCARCTQALDDIRGVRVTMGHLSEESAPDAGLESLLAYAQQSARRASAGPAPKPSRWRRWLLPVVGLASVSTLGILTFSAQSPELTQANLAAAEVMPSKKAAPVPSASARSAEPSAAPAPAAAAEAPPPPPEMRDDDAEYAPKDAAKTRSAEVQRAEGWALAGSGGDVGGRGRADELKAKVKGAESFGGKQSRSKTAPAEKSQREVSNLDEEALAEAAPAQAVASSSPPRDGLRLGGSSAKKEANKLSADDLAKDGAWDEGPGAPALEAVTEPLAQGTVVSAPAPSSANESRGGVAQQPSDAREQLELDRASASRAKSPMKATRKAEAVPEAPMPRPAPVTPAAVGRSEAEDSASGSSVAELSRQAQSANRAGDRSQEARLLRLALAAGASGTERAGLLNRLCDAELALGRRREGLAACNQVLTEAPGSSAAQAARRRLSHEAESVETPTSDAQPAP